VNKENQKQQKYSVITVLTKDEKEDLKVLAWESQRSMSSYLRYLLICEIENYKD
jgi:hypothetical protein